MDIGQEIDHLFLSTQEDAELDILDMIKRHVDSLNDYIKLLHSFESEINNHKEIYEYYRLKLQTLANELQEIEERSVSIQTQVINKKRMYEEIKQLLVVIEIKPEYFHRIKNPNFEDLTGLKVALNVLKSFNCKYNIKAVNEKKERINNALKEFIDEFIIYFQKRLNMHETESRGELKIHQHVYDEVRKYEFVFEYAKEHDKDNFVKLSRKYITASKTLYEKEFEQHLKIIRKSLKEYKDKLSDKMDEALGVIIESFYLIVACESNFIAKTFDENTNFVNEYSTNIFNNVVEIILDFLRDLYRINNISSINALFNAQKIHPNQETASLDIIIKFKEKIADFLSDFKKDYIRLQKQNWKTESKRKFYKNLVCEIKKNSYSEINKELCDIFLDRINDLQQEKKGKIEFIIYKLNFIKEIENLHIKENKNKIDQLRSKEMEDLEKEVIVYIFGGEKNKTNERIKNVRNLIKNMIKDDQKYNSEIRQTIKNFIVNQSDEDLQKYTEECFNK